MAELHSTVAGNLLDRPIESRRRFSDDTRFAGTRRAGQVESIAVGLLKECEYVAEHITSKHVIIVLGGNGRIRLVSECQCSPFGRHLKFTVFVVDDELRGDGNALVSAGGGSGRVLHACTFS